MRDDESEAPLEGELAAFAGRLSRLSPAPATAEARDALLYRAGMVCDRYSGALLPSVPMPLVAAMAGAGVVALAAFAWREWRSHRRGEHVDPIARDPGARRIRGGPAPQTGGARAAARIGAPQSG